MSKEYPWHYSDAQGFDYPQLKVVRLLEAVSTRLSLFVETRSPDGELHVLSMDRLIADRTHVEAAREQLQSAIQSTRHSPLRDVAEFHDKFELSYHGPPRLLPADLEFFRRGFIEEEAREFGEAKTDEERFDACLDLIYVVYGYMLLRGWNIAEGWRRVQEANMKKMRAKGSPFASERSTEYDVVKPEGWVAPNHSDLVRIP